MHYGDRVSRLRDQIIAPVDPLGFILSERDVERKRDSLLVWT